MKLLNEYPKRIWWRIFMPDDTLFAFGYREGTIDPGGQEVNDIFTGRGELKIEIKENDIFGRHKIKAGKKWLENDATIFLSNGQLLSEVEATDVGIESGIITEDVPGLSTIQMFNSLNYPNDVTVSVSIRTTSTYTQNGESNASNSITNSNTTGTKVGLSAEAGVEKPVKAGVKASVEISNEVRSEMENQITTKSGYSIQSVIDIGESFPLLVPGGKLIAVVWAWSRSYIKGTVAVGATRTGNIDATIKYSLSRSIVQANSIAELPPYLQAEYSRQFPSG